MNLSISLRAVMSLLGLAVLSACFSLTDSGQQAAFTQDFALGYTVVAGSENYTRGPISREATVQEWETPIMREVESRLGEHHGSRLYHIGIVLEGYTLAQPGIPILLSPKSALIFRFVIIDDPTQRVLYSSERQVVFEDFSTDTVLGSGLTRTKQEQIRALASTAAYRIEQELRNTVQTWSSPAPQLAEKTI